MTAPSLPALAVASGPEGVGDALRRLPPEGLRRYLMGRRWFGAKGHEPERIDVVAVVPARLGGEAAGVMIAVLAVRLEQGAEALYQLPLATREAAGEAPRSAIARLTGGGREQVLYDATEDAGFRAALARAFAAGGNGADAPWRVQPLGDGARLDGPGRLAGAEQSNTSIIFGDQAIFKLFRRVEPGENPDVEIARHLTTSGAFPHTPALLGTVTLRLPGREPAVAGMLQRYVPGSGDAWSHVLAVDEGWVRRGAGEPRFPADAAALGRVTRALHDALAAETPDPAFRPERATGVDVARWADAASTQIDRALERLAARRDALPHAARPEADRVLGRTGDIRALPARLRATVGDDAGLRIRHHGDFHLGQVLRTSDGGFLIIDFEGEPARPLEQRRAKHSAARDLAGMLRSFAYAAATLAGEGSDAATQRAAAWEGEARRAFLDGYFATGTPAYLPSAPATTDALVALFETEKVFYELLYELNNRPDWVRIPLAGIVRLSTVPGAA